MHEAEGTGVEGLARANLEAVAHELAVFCRRSAAENLVAAVAGVVQERVPQMLHVYTDLVGAPGLEHTFHHRHIVQRLEIAILSQKTFPFACLD